MKKVVKESRWKAVAGCIYTEQTVDFRSDFPGNKTTYKVPAAVAFNLDPEVAEHIVELHNRSLTIVS